MDFNCRNKTGCLKSFCAYCCTYKRDLLKNNNFEKTIEIFPRVVVCKNLKKCETYHQPLTVRNTGTLSRRVKFITEPNSEILFKVNGSTELTSGAHVSVDMYVEPTKKKLVNRNRYFFVLAEHPDIVWEIPIIVVRDPPEVYVPEVVCLHKVPANTISNYQFVIYNPLENEVSFSASKTYNDLIISPVTSKVPARDYCTMLISCKIPNQIMASSIVITLNSGKSHRVCIRMEPSEQLIHLSTSILSFGDTYMGLREQKHIHICNKSMESVSFQWTCSKVFDNICTNEREDEELVISDFLRIRNKRGCIPAMNSVLSIVTFSPPRDFDYNEEEEPPYNVNLDVYLFCPILSPQPYRLQINANILGPDIEITPKDIDVGNIYMGQIQCFTFDVINKGPIHGKIYFKHHTDQKEVRCLLSPLSVDLQPNSSGSFQLSFYRRDVGKFLTKLTFKIKSGSSLPILLRGTSLATKVKMWPKFFDYGYIPICIPQKRFALIANPLLVPIVVEPTVVDDGSEDPMILCVDNSKLPLNVRPSTYYNMKCNKSNYKANEEQLKPSYSDFGSDRRTSTTTETSSQLSLMFQDKVLDDIPAMAEKLLQSVKALEPQYQPEPGMKIIDAALDCILDRSDYFKDLKDRQNYLNMDWEALPSDAREVAIEAERFYLKPNESKSFPIVLIPNSSGPCTKNIQFKACPMGIEHSDLKTAIRSKYLVNTLRLQYTCMIPILECNDNVKFGNPLYVDMENNFHMKLKNIDVVPGFVYFKIIPNTRKGVMKINERQRKLFIAPGDDIVVDCSVMFRSVGTAKLHGLFQLIGKLVDYPFSVEATVLPPKIKIIPEKLSNKQQVLEYTRTRIFLENICPTVAKFSLSLKNEKYQFLEPLGGSLAPNQRILISIFSRYLDPGTYKNVIYIHLTHAEKLSVPVTFLVEGIPLKFEPNIKLGLDCGNIFKNDGSQDNVIKITNFGEKSYRLLFLKQKCKMFSFLPAPVFKIQPNGITLSPKAEATINITLDTSKEVSVEEDYAVDGMGEDNCRLKLFTFTARCTVIKSKVVWSKSEICLEMGQSNEKMSDTVSLINTTPLTVNVVLNAIGSFVICDQATELMEKSLTFFLEGKAMRQFTISLSKDEIDERDICQCFKGSIKCRVNNKAQKPLLLHAKIVNPGLKICPPQVTFFTQNVESYGHINIHNCGPLKAYYKWRQITSALTKTVSPKSYELLSSKTISEVILNLPDEVIMKVPRLIKSQQPELCSSEEDLSEDDIPNQDKLSVPKDKSSLWLKSLNYNKSSVRIIFKQCEPPDFLTPKDEASQIDIHEVLHYLGFERPTALEPTKSSNIDHKRDKGDGKVDDKDKIEDKNTILFQQNFGYILPKAMFKAYMFLPPIAEGYTLSSKFNLEVCGGRTESVNVILTSLKGRIQISKTKIGLNREIWHKTITGKIKITNLSPYTVKISLIETADTSLINHQLISGHVGIASPKVFVVTPEDSTNIEWKALLGLRYNFVEDIGVEVNNTTAIPINFYGTGLMPMIIPKNLNKMPQKSDDTVTDYLMIHMVFKNIQAKKTPYQTDELAGSESRLSVSLSEGRVTASSITHNKRSTRNVFKALTYSEKIGPGGLEIECLIETQKFIAALKESEELRTKLHDYYRDCVSLKAMDFQPVINLKFIICRPIPWQLPVFVMNLGQISANETKTFQVDITFFGPGKLFLSARTRTPIPGLTAWFENFQLVGCPSSFVFFLQSPDEDTLKKYTNMQKRSPDYNSACSLESVRLVHAHSYDIDEIGVHKRKKPPGEVKKMKERYTKINQPFKEKKNPLILAEICQTNDENWDNSTFKLMLLFTPSSEFYKNEQLIEDYLLIDVHFGPTLPILLRGQVIKRKTIDV